MFCAGGGIERICCCRSIQRRENAVWECDMLEQERTNICCDMKYFYHAGTNEDDLIISTCYVPGFTVSSTAGGDPLRKRQPTSCQAAPRPWRFFPISTILIPHRSFPHSAPAVLLSSVSPAMCSMEVGQRVKNLRLKRKRTYYPSCVPVLPSLQHFFPLATMNGWWTRRI